MSDNGPSVDPRVIPLGQLVGFLRAQQDFTRAARERDEAAERYRDADTAFRLAWSGLTKAQQQALNTVTRGLAPDAR